MCEIIKANIDSIIKMYLYLFLKWNYLLYMWFELNIDEQKKLRLMALKVQSSINDKSSKNIFGFFEIYLCDLTNLY